MGMRFTFHEMAGWPPLAWIARMARGESVIRVFHGSRVETGDERFSEAVWAGDYSAGEFDQTEIIYGSGGRVRGGAVTFVTSCATVDRLQAFESATHTWVSNSLACLMNHIGASLDATDPGYFNLFGTICDGLQRYARLLKTSVGMVRLCYVGNLRWDGQRLEEIAKPRAAERFPAFADYHAFLQSGIDRIAANLRDTARQFPYEMLGTLSSGYDSPAVTTLAARAGLKQAISFVHVKNGVEDCGREIARVLGVNLTLIDRGAFYADDVPEVPFLASDAKGEDVFFHSAKSLLPGKVLLTGHHGDQIWNRNCPTAGPHLIRGGRSGLSCSEHRLWLGYLHVTVPFMGARCHADIHAISNSPEMRRWDVGGEYTRPIPRRIVEEAGVPRGAFGMMKIGSSISHRSGRNVRSASTMSDYRAWLSEHASDFWQRGRVPPQTSHALLEPARWIARRGWALHATLKGLPRSFDIVRVAARHAGAFGDREDLWKFMFPWAIDRAMRRYAPAPATANVAPSLPRAAAVPVPV